MDDDREVTRAELFEANQRLRELEQRKRELAALVVHDLRNPIAAIIGHLELLRGELGEVPAGAAGLLTDLDTLAQQTLAMLATLLDVEELEEGLLVADRQVLRLDEHVAELLKRYQVRVRARELEFSVALPEALVASLDPTLIGRVLENLLDNAVRYARRRGRVEFRAARVGDVLEIRIGNDGPPVPESERARLFERYFRIEARRAAARENRGLGLYFCKLAVAAHGGHIAIESTEELPTIFVVRLPQAA